MRPPRSISGSSSAAAAAAVAMAMATVTNARFLNAGFSQSSDGTIDLVRSSSSPRPVHGSERARLAARMEEYHQFVTLPLSRRSSASTRVVDDGSGSSDLPRHRRRLQSYSSSPSSLRNLFIAGGTSLRSPSSTLSPINKYIHSNVQGGRESQPEAKGVYDYFNLPLSHSRESTPTASSPSCPSLSRGPAQFHPLDESKTSLSSTSSLPPTPTRVIFEFPYDSLASPMSPYDRPQPNSSPHRQSGHPFQPIPRRTTSSPYLVSQYAAIGSQPYHILDRRSSLPLDVHSSLSMHSHEGHSQHRLSIALSQPGFKNRQQKKDHNPKSSGLNNPQGFLVRSNSTPDIFSSGTRIVGSSIQKRQESGDTPSCAKPVENDESICVSPSRIAQNSHLSHLSEQSRYLQEVDGRNHLRPHIQQNTPQLPQDNVLNQFAQPEDPSHYALPDSDSRRRGSNAQQPPNSDFNKASSSSNEYYNSSSRLLKGLEFGTHTILDQNAPNPFFMDPQRQQQQQQKQQQQLQQQQQQLERVRQNVKEQQSISGVGWNQANPVNVHRPLIYTQPQQGLVSTQTQEILQLDCQLTQNASLISPDQKPEQRLQQFPQPMKIEPMDDDAFDSSSAMVLDDHLSLMDHLNMIPEAEAYSNNPTLTIMPQFKQENSTISSRFPGTVSKSLSSGNVAFGQLAPGGHGSTPLSTTLSSLTVSAPSEFAAIGSNTTTVNTNNDIKHDLKSNNDLMFYFDTSETLRPESTLNQNPSFTYADHNVLQIKVEPGLVQRQQHRQTQSNMSHYALERQHPFDPSPMLEQQQQPQCDRQSFDHENSALSADYCYRPLQ
ncbi:hypothetical protein BGX20_000224 [Mortierella sp. AD010]|nr:hypothetical protein BGX20_000224 [Mortierella sp. AD010]